MSKEKVVLFQDLSLKRIRSMEISKAKKRKKNLSEPQKPVSAYALFFK